VRIRLDKGNNNSNSNSLNNNITNNVHQTHPRQTNTSPKNRNHSSNNTSKLRKTIDLTEKKPPFLPGVARRTLRASSNNSNSFSYNNNTKR
jgi:hypothetical protein